MKDDFLKPPSFAIWMLGIVSGGAFLGGVLGSPVDTVASWLVVAGVAVAAWTISRWLGRCIGVGLSGLAHGMREGFQEGVEQSRQQRAERAANGRS